MDLHKSLGVGVSHAPADDARLIQFINLKLAALGCPTFAVGDASEWDGLVSALLARHRETDRLLANYLCPADWRIQGFLDDYLDDCPPVPRLPPTTFVLDRHGLSRRLSLPPDREEFSSDIVRSYRVHQGVLHNPVRDRRTTQGVFHIADGGLPVPADKIAVPRVAFAALLRHALNPPTEMLALPFTASRAEQARCFVSLLLRPVVCPAVPGVCAEKTMEIRFFAPGTLVCNLDFVESIFGNAGDPYLPENDAGLDIDHWTGQTGCVILAPHLTQLTKQSLGLPHWDKATERQRRDGVCWRREDERYNDGQSFKITARDERGVIVTMIADNYFGYCKKEVKTQISYAANLYGACEEEHSGGALVYTSYDLGEEFSGNLHVANKGHSFKEVTELYGAIMDIHPEGYGVDKKFPDIIYVPEDVHFELHTQTASWASGDGRSTIKLRACNTYVRPSGYRVHMEKPPGGRAWRLVGTVAEGTLLHKPSTVSGGGKSEISKSLADAILHGPVFVADFQTDFDAVGELLARDYSCRFRDPAQRSDHRGLLSPERSLGSVIKMFTPSREFSDEYNAWLATIPQYRKELVFVVKRFCKPEWNDHWREHFSVNIVDGLPGSELHCDNRKLVANYLRVGYEADGAWRVFGLRKDFHPSAKLAVEDDISVSVVVPADGGRSQKFVSNCEYRLFQRPDEAIHPGYDRQTEADFAQPNNFFSNYEPLHSGNAQDLIDDAISFVKYTEPIQELLHAVSQIGRTGWFVCPSQPRLVDGARSKNPRYLQDRPGLRNSRDQYLAERAARLQRRLPLDQAVLTPVDVVVPGRRNNPRDLAGGVGSLAVFNPIHYLELPELFMEFICSMTGKSPSTTGAGSEGALTKGPFNALPPIIDLNNAVVAWILTRHEGFISSAGYVGPQARVDHDISLLIPEIFCRMRPAERDPRHLIGSGALEKCADIEYQGRRLLASRLGYRITDKFVRAYFGRIFNNPHVVFTEPMLRPELQDLGEFAEGMDNIVATQRRVAQLYFDDGSVAAACPPLRALLHIMLHDEFEGKGLDDPTVRALFQRETLLASEWYAARLDTKQAADVRLWQRHLRYLDKFLTKANYTNEAGRLGIQDRQHRARETLEWLRSLDYRRSLIGTIGAQPLGNL